MPERSVSDSFWTDPFVAKLSPEAKSLYLFTWTNSHCNAAGIYELGFKTIEFETGWPEHVICNCLAELAPKVVWYDEFNILWVRPFLKRQSKSPTFLIAVVKALRHLPEKIIIEFLNYNLQRYSLRLPVERIDTLSIPYRYPIDTLHAALFCTAAGGGEGKGNNINSLEGESEGVGETTSNNNLAEISGAYEDNIGMITPAVADELKVIAEEYPRGWFIEAMKEAVNSNVRKLKYIKSILERWRVEGFKSPLKKSQPSRGLRSTRPGRVPTAEELEEQKRRHGL